MWLGHTLWLLLCYVQYIKCNILEEYEDISRNILYPPEDITANALPIELGKDRSSGCICRSTKNRKVIVCFGNYECKKFPKVNRQSEMLVVRTTVLPEVRVGELDSLYYLKALRIEANHQLKYLQPGLFRNLTTLHQLSISYNTALHVILEGTFDGLKNLRELILVNNGFSNILRVTPAFQPTKLPSLRKLDLSENSFEMIPENAFKSMRGSPLRRLDINLCRLDFIHPDSFLHLEMLQELSIGENDLNSSIIGDFLMSLKKNNRNLTHLDLNSMGFRKHPPRHLMEIIANTTIKRLTLSYNQFEIISDDTFPTMTNIKVLELRGVSALSIGPNAFEPKKFPDLRILLLSANNLPGIHWKHISNQQLVLLDLSLNKGTTLNPMYFEIDRGAFLDCRELRVLNLAFNRMKSIFDYTFVGLEKLKMLNLENGTIFHIGDGTFKPMRHLEILNLANNPLTANENLTSAMFEGLNELKILILKNCGIKHFYVEDNIFKMMPNLTHLTLRNNEMYYITSELLKPLKNLQVLDLSENLLISWWKPLFVGTELKPRSLYLTDNKISHFTLAMIQDMNLLFENKGNFTIEIDLLDNVFICDCASMYQSYAWLQVNGSAALKEYFRQSNFLCSSPDQWEDRRVADYFSSIKNMRCLMYEKISSMMLLVWTAPSIVTLIFLALVVVCVYKYKLYITYWLFLAKLALGRKFLKHSSKTEGLQGICPKYDAFVSYCSEDREFVSEMVNQLERSPPCLKLCIYERDFEIGSFISEAILGSIKESRYIILIISNNFAKSQWCRWETQLAEYHRLFLEDGTSYDPLVLIRIGNVESKYLTTTLKFLLKTKIYLSWDERRSDEFWMKLRNVIVKN
ncbi:toll-like receptor 2 [Vanessa cardui]|uniref:toll-like receptor 2 n=1 Tax=Vanessa cardui TaxID=171605 RepID=UPI001F12FA73|nr:toll-like receptor 2 [Vanessa cardui]XP_046969475.1 toll-like receptor 2 [Vanessa cardui]